MARGGRRLELHSQDSRLEAGGPGQGPDREEIACGIDGDLKLIPILELQVINLLLLLPLRAVCGELLQILKAVRARGSSRKLIDCLVYAMEMEEEGSYTAPGGMSESLAGGMAKSDAYTAPGGMSESLAGGMAKSDDVGGPRSMHEASNAARMAGVGGEGGEGIRKFDTTKTGPS